MTNTSNWDALISFLLRTTYWIKDISIGSVIWNQYSDVKAIHSHKKQNWQQNRSSALQNLLYHATRNSKFYQNIVPDSLQNFPLVNKEILIENYNLNIVPESVLPWQKGPYIIQRTSGSTGTPFAVPMDSRKRARRVGELKYYGEIIGFNSHDKLMQLRIWSKWQKKSFLQQLRENITAWDISDLSDESLMKLYTALRKNRYSAIREYASSMDYLAKFVKKKKLPKLPYLKIAIAGSETLFEETSVLVREQLGCNIISQYANEENGILAQQTVDKRIGDGFELNDSSYFFEVLKMDTDEPAEFGELGRIVVTDLYNYAFPMIRYENGDCGILECTVDGEVYLSKIYGRKMDLVYSTDGTPIAPMTLARILKNIEGIKQWQFIQKASNHYCVKIIPTLEKSTDTTRTIEQEIREYFGKDAKIVVEYVMDIPVLKSGKRKSVICELTR